MDSARPPAPSRRTLLRGAALSALTTVAFLAAAPPQPTAAWPSGGALLPRHRR
ncbi:MULTISPECIES: hypothetical protein [unclassified Streptomyces]|uniref:hypothetical protein n=1 Tax=unclassified Streptomyces TaxID=2593676 RepID=UPI0027428086|nr:MULTISPECIES: hypothetical protein [unclassified Streptomyces]